MEFSVNESKCISCGSCAADCPVMILTMENKKPVVSADRAENCLDCQHCMAVCPAGAVEINGVKPENSLSVKGFRPDQQNIELMMRSRRSCRRYKQENVDAEILTKIINTAAYAPTGKNFMQVKYTVIDDISSMKNFTGRVKEEMKRIRGSLKLPEGAEFIHDFISLWVDRDIDVFFRNAPHLMLISTPPDVPCPEDSLIATAYFEMTAQAFGLGTMWDGLAKFAIEILSPDIRAMLEIPEDHIIGYPMIFGYPAVRYHRTTQRRPMQINSVKIN